VIDLHARLANLLEEHHRKSPRVQARLALELIKAAGTGRPPPPVTPVEDRPDPAIWTEAVERIEADPFRRLVDSGVATTRNRTHAAIRALGLDPTEVRALVVEHDFIRVYRWTDRDHAQTLPILEEKTA
jgi:hypothetical protein